MNRVKDAFRNGMSIVAMIIIAAMINSQAMQLQAQSLSIEIAFASSEAEAVETFVPAAETRQEETATEEVALETISEPVEVAPVEITVASEMPQVELADVVVETETLEASIDAEEVEVEGGDDQQSVPAVEDPDVVKAQRALEAAKRRADERKVEGKKIQEAMQPEPPTAVIPIPVGETLAPKAGAETKEFVVRLPSCNDIGVILAAIEKIKAQKAKAGEDELKKFFETINSSPKCEDLILALQAETDLNTLTPVAGVSGPESKQIITEPKDMRLAEYGIGYGRPFTKWTEGAVSKKELKTPQDYLDNRQTLLDHIQYFQVAEGINGHLAKKVASMKAEMPEVLNGCLDQPWRFAADVKLCQWVDAADVPVWVSTWAKKTVWGLTYEPSKKRPAPMLVAWLPKSQEYVFWAGPCGGNGGWLPSGSPFKFTVESVAPECKMIEGDLRKLTSESQSATFTAKLAAEGIDPKNLDTKDMIWLLNGSQVASGSLSVTLTGKQLSEGSNKLEFKAQGREKSQENFYPMSCNVQVEKNVPPPPPPPIPAVCNSVTVSPRVIAAKGEKITISVNHSVSTDFPLATIVYSIDGREVKRTKDTKITLNADQYLDGKKHSVLVQGLDKNGQVIWTCPGDNNSNVFEGQLPCPNCKSIDGPGKIKIGTKEHVYTIKLDREAEIVEWQWTLNGENINAGKDGISLTWSNVPVHATKLDKHGNKVPQPGKYKLTYVGKDKNGCTVKCEKMVDFAGKKFPWWILALILAAVILALLLSGGGAAPAAVKVGAIVIGV